MKRDYGDIIDLIKSSGKVIKWYDMDGVPRCVDFSPELIKPGSNVSALVLAECQICQEKYIVEHSRRVNKRGEESSFFQFLAGGYANVYDPPYNLSHAEDCCGFHMTSNVVKVLEKYVMIDNKWEIVK